MYTRSNGDVSQKPRTHADRSNTSSNGAISLLSAVTLDPSSPSTASYGTSTIGLLKHLHQYQSTILHMPRDYEIMSLSRSSGLVRSALLAITASHLRQASPGVLQHRIAEHFQQSLALEEYQKALDTPFAVHGQSGVNSLFLSAVLLNMLAFVLPESEIYDKNAEEPDVTRSWVFNSQENQLGWLALQCGLRFLLKTKSPSIETSLGFLGLIFLGVEIKEGAFLTAGHGTRRIPDTWMKVFGLDEQGVDCDGKTSLLARTEAGSRDGSSPPPSTEVFRLPAFALAQLRWLEPSGSNIFLNLMLLGKIQGEFRTLLIDRDERALWLFGYWLGLLCRFKDIWWAEKRANRDYAAILMWLKCYGNPQRHGIDTVLWRDMMGELELASILVGK